MEIRELLTKQGLILTRNSASTQSACMMTVEKIYNVTSIKSVYDQDGSGILRGYFACDETCIQDGSGYFVPLDNVAMVRHG